MIIGRVPLRISIAGGGTDLPSFYSKFGSTFISAAIDKYIYITYHRSRFDKSIRLRYSKMEEVSTTDKIQHEIIRETFKANGVKSNVELTSHAEIPSGTGLGSSGSFGVGILHAIKGENAMTHELAEEATRIQMGVLGHPIGVQDQYVAAFGGVNVYEVSTAGKVGVAPLNADTSLLNDRLALFFTGFKRNANEVLVTQKENAEAMEETLHNTQKLCYDIKDALERGNQRKFGELMNHHWEEKKKRSPIMTNRRIDDLYDLALKNGAVGGKLVGAGGGGFLLFYTEDREKLIRAMPVQHVPFRFDFEGSKILQHD